MSDNKIGDNAVPSLSYLFNLANKAGSMILENFFKKGTTEWKEDGTPVTETDKKINDLVLESFSMDFYKISVCAEEESVDVLRSNVKVICDPLDGTSAFLSGVPVSTFCLAIIFFDVPFRAVIYDPFLSRMWCAEKNKGTFLNGERISVSTHATLKKSMVCVVYWNNAPYKLDLVSNEIIRRGAIWSSPGSIAYFGALVASGQFHATIFPGSKPLETAAMQLIAEEAGGRATDIFGKPLRYDKGNISGHVISNGRIHDELIEIVSLFNH